MKLIFYLLIYLCTLFNLYGNNILHIKIDGAISPATSKYFDESLTKSKEINAHIILIELNTPGGLVSTTREMVQKILNSEIPIVMYVSPKGSRAASAGTFLMYASHISAMAPSTNIGAATPVSLGGNNNPINSQKDDKTRQIQNSMQKKIINDTAAYLKSIAEHKKRNINWAIEAVKEGKSISSLEALEKNVVDFLANDVKELLTKINNKKIKVNNKDFVVSTTNSNIILFEVSWKTKVLMSISNPNIVYIFLILAIYGILFEMMNPGSIFPGVIGAVSALIAFYSLNILPFNYVGLLLIFFGIVLIIVEITIAGFGILGIAGTISFAFGSFLLFDEKTLGVSISYPLILSLSLVSLALFGYIIAFIFKSRNNKSCSGVEYLIGQKAFVVSNDVHIKVESNGELWNAKSNDKLSIGDEVVIERVDGLILEVRSLK